MSSWRTQQRLSIFAQLISFSFVGFLPLGFFGSLHFSSNAIIWILFERTRGDATRPAYHQYIVHLNTLKVTQVHPLELAIAIVSIFIAFAVSLFVVTNPHFHRTTRMCAIRLIRRYTGVRLCQLNWFIFTKTKLDNSLANTSEMQLFSVILLYHAQHINHLNNFNNLL